MTIVAGKHQRKGNQYGKDKYGYGCYAQNTVQRLAIIDGTEKGEVPKVEGQEYEGQAGWTMNVER